MATGKGDDTLEGTWAGICFSTGFPRTDDLGVSWKYFARYHVGPRTG